jgi:hypothetical protein
MALRGGREVRAAGRAEGSRQDAVGVPVDGRGVGPAVGRRHATAVKASVSRCVSATPVPRSRACNTHASSVTAGEVRGLVS